MQMFTVKEIAEELQLCEDTVRRLFKTNEIEGVRKTVGLKRYVLTYTREEIDLIKDAYKKHSEIAENYFTASQVAEMAGCTSSWISYTAIKNNIDHIVKPNHQSKVAFYSKDAAEKIIEIINKRKAEKELKKKNKEAVTVTPDENAEAHPLVIDPRCLRLSYWPDIVPECFKVEAE